MSTVSGLRGRRELVATSPWWVHLTWLLSAAALGAALPAVFVGLFRLPRALFLVPYVALSGTFLFAYARWSRTRWVEAPQGR